MTASSSPSFYHLTGPGRVASTPHTGSPWGPASQHGGPPSALLVRAVEQLPEAAGRVVGRVTVELLGPVPVGPLEVAAEVLRPGRSVLLAGATLTDPVGGRPVARASVWLFPDLASGAAPVGPPLGHGPGDGEEHPRPPSWSPGYLDAVSWRWVRGAVLTPGPAVVWMRPEVDLVDGERLGAAQRVLVCADSASGVSAALDPASWRFLNTELTVHLLRPPRGPWLCLEAATTLGPGSVGIATSSVHDEEGLVARSAQALLVVPVEPRPAP